METNNTTVSSEAAEASLGALEVPQVAVPPTAQPAAAAATTEGATNMAEKKSRKTDDSAVVVRISGDAAVALTGAIEAATKKSGFKPRASQVIEAALIAYSK